ncbi:MAG: haloalkane dehalogenase [Dermatophilaceae bacterium]
MRRREVITGAVGTALIGWTTTGPATAATDTGRTTATPGAAGGTMVRGPIRRTPESQFTGLADYPFRPRYAVVDPRGLRMHYLDEGRPDGPVVLLAHGNPAWSYMYRHWIPPLVARGYRVIAPDLIGFGRSDKLDRSDITYANQVTWAGRLVRQLGLRDVTLYAQDWGGLIQLRVLTEQPHRFARVAISNTGLPSRSEDYTPAFRQWQQNSQVLPNLGEVVEGGTVRDLADAEVAAYEAPWPTEELKAAAREMPLQAPETGSEQAAANEAAKAVLRSWTKPLLVLWSTVDTVFEPPVKSFFRDEVPGARGMPHRDYDADHFIQEDQTPALVGDLLGLLRTG